MNNNNIRILIVGMGYAGNRYLRAFKNSSIPGIKNIKFAYHSRTDKKNGLTFYKKLEDAFSNFNPNIAVITVTDGEHFNIIKKFNNYTGFVICEKPLVNRNDDLDLVRSSLGKITGFCMDMVERYSVISSKLKKIIKDENLHLLRVNFFWGKDRIYDPRPTSGISSEIIHSLDLIQWILDKKISVKKVIGVKSDFSIEENNCIDNVMVVGKIDNAICSGYSSFVNIVRQRTIDFIFYNSKKQLVFAHMVFDTPTWDKDYLKVWIKGEENKPIVDFTTKLNKNNSKMHTIVKLTKQVDDILNYTMYGKLPNIKFVDLEESIFLQKLLDKIDSSNFIYNAPSFVIGENRPIIDFGGNLELLG